MVSSLANTPENWDLVGYKEGMRSRRQNCVKKFCRNAAPQKILRGVARKDFPWTNRLGLIDRVGADKTKKTDHRDLLGQKEARVQKTQANLSLKTDGPGAVKGKEPGAISTARGRI